MQNEISQAIIDQYLSKQLKGSALTDFESKMNTDSSFKKEVETQAFLHRGINKFGQDEMKKKLKLIRAEVVGKEKPSQKAKVVSLGQKKKVRPFLRWSVAATIALVVGASFYYVATRQNVSSLDLYASYYQPYSVENSVRSAPAPSNLTQANQLYKAKKFEAALPLFLQTLEIEPENAEIQLAIGISQLELNRMEQASQTFSSINNPLYKDQAQWYLAMTFLKQSDLANAKTVLESIKEGDFNYAKVQEILESI